MPPILTTSSDCSTVQCLLITIVTMFRILALLAIAAIVVGGVWLARPDQDFLARQWLTSRLQQATDAFADRMPEEIPTTIAIQSNSPNAAWFNDITESVRLDQRFQWTAVDPEHGSKPDHTLWVDLASTSHSATLRYRFDNDPIIVRQVSWLAVLPPLLAIVTAIIFRHVIACLVLGVLAGGVIAVWPAGGGPLYGLWHAFYAYLIQHALLNTFRLEIVAFVLLLSATVGLAQQSGGIAATIQGVARFCRTARAARVGTVLVGWLLFFDDYLNCIIVGNALRPLTDRYRVSREKLAYIVDSTAAPMAGLALVSTWIAFEITQIAEGLTAAGLTEEPFDIFVRTIPFRFYCLFTLTLVFIVAWSGRDYGPMRKAEQRTLTEGPPKDNGSEDNAANNAVRGGAVYALLPIGATLIAIVVGLWWTGQSEPSEPPLPTGDPLGYVRQILSQAESATAFSRAAFLGYALALVMVLAGRVLTVRETLRGSLRSVRVIMTAVAVLFLAWSIGAACREVGTADYLVAMFHQAISPVGFSVVVFGLSCLIAFSTGSSYSTMAILLPNVVPLALAVGRDAPTGAVGMVVMSIGAVLEGAIFGDHCSPISDTTILSAIASRCDPIEHVRTQMPYAVTAMAVATVIGYLPVSLGVPPIVCLIAGGGALLAVVRLAGRPACA